MIISGTHRAGLGDTSSKPKRTYMPCSQSIGKHSTSAWGTCINGFACSKWKARRRCADINLLASSAFPRCRRSFFALMIVFSAVSKVRGGDTNVVSSMRSSLQQHATQPEMPSTDQTSSMSGARFKKACTFCSHRWAHTKKQRKLCLGGAFSSCQHPAHNPCRTYQRETRRSTRTQEPQGLSVRW